MEPIDVSRCKLRSLLSGHLVGYELTAFLCDQEAGKGFILAGDILGFLKKISESNFVFS